LEIPSACKLLFSSEAAAYHGAAEHAQRPRKHLLPFECAVFGPDNWPKLATRDD
jgi:hypothetical protein